MADGKIRMKNTEVQNTDDKMWTIKCGRQNVDDKMPINKMRMENYK